MVITIILCFNINIFAANEETKITNAQISTNGTLSYNFNVVKDIGSILTIQVNMKSTNDVFISIYKDGECIEDHKYVNAASQYEYDYGMTSDKTNICGEYLVRISEVYPIGDTISAEIVLYQEHTYSDWAINDIFAGIKTGIIPEEMQSHYNSAINREDFCKMIYQLLNRFIEMPLGAKTFTDTNNTEVNSLSELGIIQGKSNSTFNPTDMITREEAATVIARVVNALNISTESNRQFEYTDEQNISDWAKESVYYMKRLHILEGTGNGYFSPKDNITKEQSIAALMRVYNECE